MNAPAPRILARCGTDVLVDEGSRWVFGSQPGTGGNLVVFVLALLGGIVALNSITFFALPEVSRVVPLAMLLAGGAMVAIAVKVARAARRRRETTPVQPRLVLDFAAGMLLNERGQPLAPLGQVRFDSEFQLASSARKLVCRWAPGRQIVVMRGDAFGGHIGTPRELLRGRGLSA